MERLLQYLPYISLGVGGWAILNGALHDTFVLAQGRKYDRELLRLLMDGHILITCGIMQALAYFGLNAANGAPWGYYVAGAAALSLLVYCAMIFPFLKSVGMITVNLLFLGLLVTAYLKR